MNLRSWLLESAAPLAAALPFVGGLLRGIAGGLATHGGTLSGPTTITGPPASSTGAAIQALHDALPAQGGQIMLAANTTYDVTSQITISRPNVHLSAPSWQTIVQRDAAYTGILLSVTGSGCIIEGFTVDGNATANPSFEIGVSGDNTLVRRMQIINSHGAGHLSLAGNNSRATGNTITGLGINLGSQTGYGIWAVNHQTVKIDNNVVTGTGIDGIGFDGAGSVVSGNQISGCHCYTGGSGGQLATYPTATGAVITGNWVGVGGGNSADGIEVNGSNVVVSGNEVNGVLGLGIHLTASASHVLVNGNLVKNIGQTGVPLDGIYVEAGVSDFQIINNRVLDDRATKFMRSALSIVAGAGNRFVVRNNVLWPALNYPFGDASTGLDKIIGDNVGLDDVIASVASAATVTFPYNSRISLTGTTPITAIAASGAWTGRSIMIIPTAAAQFVAGGNIANSLTATAGVPLTAMFDGTQWYFSTMGLPTTGGTLSGPLTAPTVNVTSALNIGATAGSPTITINGASAQARLLSYQAAGVVQFTNGIGANNNWFVGRYSGGSFVDFPIVANPNGTVGVGTSGGNVLIGAEAQIATTATLGHLLIPFCNGAPTGVPNLASTGIALIYDTANHKLWAYDNLASAWRGIVLT